LPPNPVDPNSPGMVFRFDCDVDNDGDIIDDLGKDYNGDGTHGDPRTDPDACYRAGPGQQGLTTETIVAQGGIIHLTHFNFGLGLRFHF